MLGETYDAIKPGGWFESVETTVGYFEDDAEGRPIPIPESSVIHEWCKLGREAGERLGRSFNINDKLEGWMKDTGFINVTQRVFKVPSGPWPKDPKMKDIGRYNLLNLLEALGKKIPWDSNMPLHRFIY